MSINKMTPNVQGKKKILEYKNYVTINEEILCF